MAKAEPNHPAQDRSASGNQTPPRSAHKKHIDTGEHAKKAQIEGAHVVDEGLGMSKYDSTRKG